MRLPKQQPWSALDKSRPGPSVLLIASDVRGREALATLLQSLNYAVIAPPQLSLAAGFARHAEVVLADLSHSVEAHVDVCRTIKRRYPMLPVIGVIGEGATAILNRPDSGIDDFLCHPFSEGELGARLLARLRRKEEDLKSAVTAGKHKALVDLAAAGLFVLKDGWFSYVNSEFARLFNYSADEIAEVMTIHDLVVSEERFATGRRFQRWMEDEVPNFTCSFSAQQKGGRVVSVELHATRIVGAGHRVYAGTVLDVSRRQRAEEAKHQQSEYFQALIERAHDVVTVIDRAGTLLYVSASVKSVLSYDPEALLGKKFIELVHPDDHQHWRGSLGRLLGSTELLLTRCRVRAQAGGWRLLEISARDLSDDSVVKGIVLNSRDVTEQQATADALQTLALRDPLTGLPNRTLFLERLAQAEARAKRSGANQYAVLYMDLDAFKVVNDGLGHGVGDTLLLSVARRIEKLLGQEDTVARFGGDEFGILINEVNDVRSCTRVAQRVLDALSTPFDIDGSQIFTSASIGIVLRSGEDESCEQLLRNADLAMYRAKAEGGAYQMFDPGMQEAAMRRLRIETDLRGAARSGQLRLHYQPIVDLKNGRLAGFEALVRWEHPDRGMIPPDDFIGIAEETGQIDEIGRWVLSTACHRISEWQEISGRPDLFIAVNLSASQLRQRTFTRQVRDSLAEAGLSGPSLKLEITESMVIHDTESASRALWKLKELDVQLYMDDFGTGYASLGYLHQLPLDGLKIDRSFVSPMHSDPRHAVLVKSTLSMAAGLGMKVVAEGIELNEHLLRLRALRCDYGQGYLFSRPLEAEMAVALLKQNFLPKAGRSRVTLAKRS